MSSLDQVLALLMNQCWDLPYRLESELSAVRMFLSQVTEWSLLLLDSVFD